VLVFDQFEELFSGAVGDTERVQQVRNSLADLMDNRIPVELASEEAGEKRSQLNLLSQNYRIVLSFREDYLPDLKSWEMNIPSLLRNYLRLEPMTRQCAIEAVREAGHAVLDDGVAPLIVDFVGEADGRASEDNKAFIEPVLLCLCCYQLNRRRKKGKKINRALVSAIPPLVITHLLASRDVMRRGESVHRAFAALLVLHQLNRRRKKGKKVGS
jgi:hypothetical protein